MSKQPLGKPTAWELFQLGQRVTEEWLWLLIEIARQAPKK